MDLEKLARGMEINADAVDRFRERSSLSVPPPIVNLMHSRKVEDSKPKAFNELCRQIELFQADLDSDHEVGAYMSSFGQVALIHIRSFSQHAGDLVVFSGFTESGDRVRLIQHLHQLNVLLVAAKKIDEEPHRIMGFVDTNE